jgi:hypothetical protein
MEHEVKQIDNPISKQIVIIGFVMSGFILLLGAVLFLISHSIVFLLLDGGIAAFLFFMIWFREFHNRPRSVMFEENGIRLNFRNQKTEIIPFVTMRSILINYSRSSSSNDRRIRSGAVYLKGKYIPILVNAEIVMEVKDRYQEKMGVAISDYQTTRRRS